MIDLFDKKKVMDINIYYNEIIEASGYFTPYNKNIDYISYIKRICENLKQIDLLNQDKDNLFNKTDLIRGLLELTKQHKDIYEAHLVIDNGFKEQAGSYDDVIKSYNYYKEKYDKEYLKPKANIDKEISKLGDQISLWLKESCLNIEPVFSMSSKITYRIYN
jgi:hypothetical protein